MVLEQELKALYPHPQTTGREDWTCQGFWKPQSPPPVTHLQQGHTINSSLTVPLTGDQALKHRSPWEPYLSTTTAGLIHELFSMLELAREEILGIAQHLPRPVGPLLPLYPVNSLKRKFGNSARRV